MNEQVIELMNYLIEQVGGPATLSNYKDTITTPIVNGEITTTEQIDELL